MSSGALRQGEVFFWGKGEERRERSVRGAPCFCFIASGRLSVGRHFSKRNVTGVFHIDLQPDRLAFCVSFNRYRPEG